MRPLKIRNLCLNLLLCFSSLILFFAAAEGGFRIFKEFSMAQTKVDKPDGGGRVKRRVDSKSAEVLRVFSKDGWRMRPNEHAVIEKNRISGRTIRIDTNSQGFRHPETGEKKAGEKRVLVLGDSITFADYVESNETYPAALQELIGKETDKVTVINAGLPGADLAMEYHLLLDSGLSVSPDVVLIGLYLNDASDFFGIEPMPAFLAKSHFLCWIWRKTHEVYFAWRSDPQKEAWAENFMAGRKPRRGDWRRDKDAFDSLVISARNDWGYSWAPSSWAKIRNILESLQTLSRERNFRLAVVLFPVRHQVESDLYRNEPQISMGEIAKSMGLDYLDLLPELRAAWRSGLKEMYYDHCHLTPEGNKRAGNLIFSFLKDRKIIEAGPSSSDAEPARPRASF